MAKRDYYDILGISKTSSKEDIKSSYKKLAKKYHPDVSKDKDSAEKFKEISEAYAVLSDDTKKSQYDKFGHAGFDQRYSQEDIFRGFDFDIFNDIFNGDSGGDSIFDMFFGTSRGRRHTSRGSDLRYDIELTLKEAARGTKESISFFSESKCESCNGTGSFDGKTEKCNKCNGKGNITHTTRTPFGYFQQTTICSNCNGSGEQIKNHCKKCDGSGINKKERHLSVTIPAGVDTGHQLRLKGEGSHIKNGEAGDLYIVIHVKEDPIFERRDNDLYLKVPVSFSQAALGDKIEVPTLDGNISMNLPSSTQTGTLFRLKEKGIKHLNSNSIGDQYVEIIVRTPTKISKEMKEYFQKLSKITKEDLKYDSKSFFSKIKDVFD